MYLHYKIIIFVKYIFQRDVFLMNNWSLKFFKILSYIINSHNYNLLHQKPVRNIFIRSKKHSLKSQRLHFNIQKQVTTLIELHLPIKIAISKIYSLNYLVWKSRRSRWITSRFHDFPVCTIFIIFRMKLNYR